MSASWVQNEESEPAFHHLYNTVLLLLLNFSRFQHTTVGEKCYVQLGFKNMAKKKKTPLFLMILNRVLYILERREEVLICFVLFNF